MALRYYGIFRLASRISQLNKDLATMGISISTSRVPFEGKFGHNGSFSKYWFDEAVINHIKNQFTFGNLTLEVAHLATLGGEYPPTK